MIRVYEDKNLAESITQQLWAQCEQDEYCDVVLIAGSEEMRISSHRFILSASSDYFKEIFTSSKSTSREVTLPDLDGNILKSLIRFCYIGSIEIKIEYVGKLILTAKLLGLDIIVDACGAFIVKHLHPNNCLGFALLADQCDLPAVSKQANDYSLEYFMDVCKSDEFLSLNAERMGQLLSSDDISVAAEEDVVKELISWLQHDRDGRANHKDELLKFVRMPLLDRSFLDEYVRPMCTTAECLQLYTEAIEQSNATHSTKSRKSYQFLLNITESPDRSGMYLHYYNQSENKWMKWLQNFEYRLGFEIAVIEDNLYIIGGFDAMGEFLNTVVSINLKTMSMRAVNPMKEQRAVFAVAVLKGSLYALGGWAGHDTNSVEKWDPKTNMWSEVAPMTVNRSNFGVAVLNDKLYVVGGASSDANALSSVEYYDPDQNQWKSIAPMNESRTHLGVAVADGLIYAVGGYQSKTVEHYDPELNSWTIISSLNDNLVGARSCTAFRDKVVVCYNDRIEEYNAAANEWTVSPNLRGLANIYCIFSYSDQLLMSEFAEN